MANTNLFKEGDAVNWNGNIGKITANDRDFRYWQVEFKDCIRIIHYEDLELHFDREANGGK